MTKVIRLGSDRKSLDLVDILHKKGVGFRPEESGISRVTQQHVTTFTRHNHLSQTAGDQRAVNDAVDGLATCTVTETLTGPGYSPASRPLQCL